MSQFKPRFFCDCIRRLSAPATTDVRRQDLNKSNRLAQPAIAQLIVSRLARVDRFGPFVPSLYSAA